MYAPALAWWLDYFTPESVLVINSSAMRVDTVGTINKVARFLGLSHTFTYEDIFDDDG